MIQEKKAIFNLRWDFYIPTRIPITIEVDGKQHDEYSGFMHGSLESFAKSKSNDAQKDKLHENGKVILIRIKDKMITYEEFLDLIEPYIYLIEEAAANDNGRNKINSFTKGKNVQGNQSVRGEYFGTGDGT